MKGVTEETRRQRIKIQREIVDAIASREPDRAATAAAANIDATYASFGVAAHRRCARQGDC